MQERAQTVIILACRTLVLDGESEAEDRPSSFELAYLVYDRSLNKIVSSSKKIIETQIPEKKEDVQSCLSGEPELTETEGLRGILQELDVHLGKQPAYVVTCGPLALRHYLHPQASREKVKLHEALYSYVDIILEFKRIFSQLDHDAEDIDEVASHLNIDIVPVKPSGVERCQAILEVMQQLPKEGSRQLIQPQYSQVPSSAPLLEDTIVRVRGFSPSTTEFKLAKFFAGLNIESGGIVMCMTPGGRPPCEAFVRFSDKEQRDLALKRNGSKFGSRSIEICEASVQEFSRVANQDNAAGLPQALANFLLMAAPAAVIIRMRGLPYNTKPAEIVTFFGDESPVFRGQHGILFVYHSDRRPTGDAFVLFETAEQGKQALLKHRQTIGKRYVELFQTTRHEVAQVFHRYTFANNGVVPFAAIRALRPSITADHVNIPGNSYVSNIKDIIRLRGLPYAATVQDILDFLDEFSKYVVPAGVHMVYNMQGRPSGDAFIEMRSAEHAQKASEALHKKHIGERYIEVFQCSFSDMSFMLAHGIPSFRSQHNSWVSAQYSPRTPPHVPPHVPTAFPYPPVSSATLSYPPVSSPSGVPHTTSSPHCSMISVPSSPTLSPTGRVFVTSPSHGYVTYTSQPYNVFNFSYPPSNVAIDGSMPQTPPVISPTQYDSTVFFPTHGYQVNDYPVTQMDPVYVPVNPYVPSANAYYPSNEPGHMPAYVETYSG